MNILETIIVTIASGLIGGAISYYFAQKIEDYKFSQAERQKAEMIATFFAKWIKYRGKERDFLNDKELIDYYEELNKMSLEITLWIKDEKVLNEIMSRTQLKDGVGNIFLITTKIRKLILNLKDDKFDYKNITNWPNPEETKKLFKL
ncbi:MAG: hypothetical protein ACREGI_04870 [Candidatus Levyibacteriota bacterium]